MANAKRDQNNVPTLIAVSSADGVTPVLVYANPTTHRLLTEPAAGVPAVYVDSRLTGQTAAVASVATYTVGASDATFWVSGNVNVTAYTAGNFTLRVTYTNESNSVVNADLQGHFTSGYTTSISGAGSFEAQPIQIRAKAGTTITILTQGTFTTLTYNVEGTITKIA